MIEQILNMISSQAFADFYADDGNFGKWLTGADDRPSKEEVKKELAKLLHCCTLQTSLDLTGASL